MFYTFLDSPVGRLLVAGDATHIKVIDLHAQHPPGEWTEQAEPLAQGIRQLNEYFRRERRVFDLPLAPEGTAFQQRVWGALQQIPFGETITYGELAARIGNPAAGRAVGAANGRNPIPIVIPCHRVIGAGGKLTGFGGGLEMKAWLLAHEGIQPAMFNWP